MAYRIKQKRNKQTKKKIRLIWQRVSDARWTASHSNLNCYISRNLNSRFDNDYRWSVYFRGNVISDGEGYSFEECNHKVVASLTVLVTAALKILKLGYNSSSTS